MKASQGGVLRSLKLRMVNPGWICCLAIFLFVGSGHAGSLIPIGLWMGILGLLLEHPSSLCSRLVSPLLTNSVVLYLVRISYSLYLIHLLVIIGNQNVLLAGRIGNLDLGYGRRGTRKKYLLCSTAYTVPTRRGVRREGKRKWLICGGPCRGRTYGPLIKSQLLYQLS
jgi:hypothetical protein